MRQAPEAPKHNRDCTASNGHLSIGEWTSRRQLLTDGREKYPNDRFETGPIVLVETAGDGTVNVEHANQTTVHHHRNHDFRRRRAVTSDVAWKLMHVGHNDRLPLGRRSSAYAVAQGKSAARGLALKRADHELSTLEEVEACPVDLGQTVKDQCRGVGGIGEIIGSPSKRE